MPDKPIPSFISKVDRDPRIFMWFMVLVVTGVYALALTNTPSLREPKTFIPFTALLIIHLFLHWQLEKIIPQPNKVFWYTLVQGVLAFSISWRMGELGLTFALFMALLGEAVGLFSLTRRGLFAGTYYLALLLIILIQNSDWVSTKWIMVSVIPMVFFVIVYVALYMRQNDARERAQSLAAELEAANRQLTEYAAQVEDLTIANERQRMARELHDTLSQGLAGLILQLEATDAHLINNHNDKARTIVADAMAQARATLADARRAIDDLRQPSLDDLDSALRIEISHFTDATGIPITFHADQTPPLPDPVKETILRAVKESLTNIANHAHAQHVEVNIRMKDKSILVTIQDDGQGFDAASIPSGHYGILGIKERVNLVNGTFDIQSENNKGTILKIEIPISSSALSGGLSSRDSSVSKPKVEAPL